MAEAPALGRDITSLELDGQELVGRSTRISLGGRKSHELVVRCR